MSIKQRILHSNKLYELEAKRNIMRNKQLHPYFIKKAITYTRQICECGKILHEIRSSYFNLHMTLKDLICPATETIIQVSIYVLIKYSSKIHVFIRTYINTASQTERQTIQLVALNIAKASIKLKYVLTLRNKIMQVR